MSLRPAAVLARASFVLLILAGCAERQALPNDPAGRLFARGLDEITDLYITPVSSRKLVLSGAARLSRLDDKFSVSETPGPDHTEVVLTYDGREAAVYPTPSHDDPHDWGALMGRLVAAAKAASPAVAALSEEQIDKSLFDGITASLDRFSRYSSPEVARDQRAMRDGFGGIGVTLDVSNDEFRVSAVTPHAPAYLAGIRADDRLLAVDRIPTAGRSESDVIHALRGPILSPVEVTVYRPSTAQKRTYRLQRELVILPTVTVSRGAGIAILQVASFNQNTTQQIVEALSEIKREMGPQLRGLVLDLRSNPGGLLDQAVSLADVFIAKGPIISTIGRHPASRQYFEASGDSVAPQVPVVVLINGGSASSSEIVAAALQDTGRAVVVGSASYGKGTVQTVLRLPNNGELTLTWAQLVAPSGYLLNDHGVVPTLCTSDLGDDDTSLRIALQRVTASGVTVPAASRPRASLDETAWSVLRHSCPARQGDHAIDVTVAKRLLADPALYSQAVHTIGPAQSIAAAPSGATLRPGEPALTGAAGTLSSSPR
ncbi:MAG: S41 family peptidase [Alphaproteobacteria bacterium]|nr:S41 family peptidase [Alphaproteobacteria bacterium]